MKYNDGFFENLGRSAAVTGVCKEKAEEIARVARASAPVDTEAYRNGIKVVVQPRSDRNAAVVQATDWKSLLVESQTGNMARALKTVQRG